MSDVRDVATRTQQILADHECVWGGDEGCAGTCRCGCETVFRTEGEWAEHAGAALTEQLWSRDAEVCHTGRAIADLPVGSTILARAGSENLIHRLPPSAPMWFDLTGTVRDSATLTPAVVLERGNLSEPRGSGLSKETV